MGDRPATEEDGHFDTMSLAEKGPDVADLEVDVVATGLRADLHFLQQGRGRLLARFLRLLLLRVPVLAVVHDAAHRRIGTGRDLDQVELLLLRDAQRVGRQHDPELRAVGVDHADLAGADVVVDSRLLFDLSYATPPGRRASPATRATNASRGTAACGAPSPRGATVLAAASRSPTTAMTGTFSTCASRTL